MLRWTDKRNGSVKLHKQELFLFVCLFVCFVCVCILWLCVFGSLTVDFEMKVRSQVSIQVIKVQGGAGVVAGIWALDRFQCQNTSLAGDGLSLNIERQALTIEHDCGKDYHHYYYFDQTNNKKKGFSFSHTDIYISVECERTSFVNSKSGWGFPSASHFILTVSPSLTASRLSTVKVAFSEGSGQTRTDVEQVKIP